MSFRKQSTFLRLTERLLSNRTLKTPALRPICRRLEVVSDVISGVEGMGPRPITWPRFRTLAVTGFGQPVYLTDGHRSHSNRLFVSNENAHEMNSNEPVPMKRTS